MYFFRVLFLFSLTTTFVHVQVHGQTPIIEMVKGYEDSIRNNIKLKGYWYSRIGQEYFKQDILDSAKKYYFKAWDSEFINNNPRYRASLNNNIGVLYQELSNYDISSYYFTKACDFYENSNNPSEFATCLLNLGIVYKELGQYSLALANLYKAEQLLINTNSRALASCYNTIATIYSRQNDWNKSLQFYKLSLSIRKELNQPKLTSESLNNIGIIYRKMGFYDSALFYYRGSLQIKNEISHLKGAAATLNNMAFIMIDRGQYDSAQYYLYRALTMKESTRDVSGIATTYNNLGLLFFYKEDYIQSLAYLKAAGGIMDSLGLKDELRDNLEYKLRAYESADNPKEALKQSKRLLILKDSLLNQGKIVALAEMQTKYETEKKSQLLEHKESQHKAELDLRHIWIISLIAGSSLLVFIGLMISSQLRKEKDSKHKIEVLFKELHHRVKNNLQILVNIFSLHSRTLQDQKALEALKSGEIRVSAMARIHQKFYQSSDMRSITLKEYLKELVEELAESYGYPSACLTVQVDHIEMDEATATPFGLIVTEVVSNAFKHAFPVTDKPKLIVEARTEGKYINLSIQDNGTGFCRENAASRNTLGLRIIDALGRQLGGNITWNANDGVLFTLRMSLNN